MDDWFYGEHRSRSDSSSGSFPESLFDAYSESFSYVPELEFDYLELMDSEELKNSATLQIHPQVYEQINAQMNTMHSQDSLDRSRPSSSSSSLRSLSGGSPDCTLPLSNLMPDSQIDIVKRSPSTQCRDLPYHVTQCNVKFPNIGRDEMAITRAMLAVISSGTSSCSASLLEEQSQQQAQTHQRSSNCQLGAFKPYNSFLAPKFDHEPKTNSQKMIKKAISMMRKIDRTKAESPVADFRSTTNQLHHVISERRRREKLNGSFHALRLLLPPGSKKDKASVLVNTKNYMSTLKAQICELEEKNRVLEMHLPPTDRNKQVGDSSRAEFEIVKASESTSGLQEINIKIMLTVECDVTELVLQVLECLKEMRVISLTSVDAKTYLPWMSFYARTILTLHFTAKDWDEVWFKEMIATAVKSMSRSETKTASFIDNIGSPDFVHPFK